MAGGGSHLKLALLKGVNRLLAFAGDSRTALNFSNGTGQFFLESRGAPSWALPITGHRFRIAHPNQYGVGGDTTTMLLARWTTVLADPAKTIVLMIGTNDRGSADMTLQASIDNVTAMLSAAAAAKKIVILSDEMPRTGLTTQLQNHVDFHLWLKNTAPTLFPNIIPWSTWAPILDPATDGSTYTPLAGLTVDGLHQNTEGGKLIGATLATAINTLFSAYDFSRPYVAGESHAQPILNANPGMTGTGGSKGSGITGSLADNWSATISSGATVVASKETIGGLEYQVLTFSGTTGAGSPVFTLRPTTDLTLSALESYDMRARVIVGASCSNILAVQTEARIDGTVQTQSRSMDGYVAPDGVPVAGFDYHLCTPPAIVPLYGVTTIRGQIIVTLAPSVVVSGVIKIGAAGSRRSA